MLGGSTRLKMKEFCFKRAPCQGQRALLSAAPQSGPSLPSLLLPKKLFLFSLRPATPEPGRKVLVPQRPSGPGIAFNGRSNGAGPRGVQGPGSRARLQVAGLGRVRVPRRRRRHCARGAGSGRAQTPSPRGSRLDFCDPGRGRPLAGSAAFVLRPPRPGHSSAAPGRTKGTRADGILHLSLPVRGKGGGGGGRLARTSKRQAAFGGPGAGVRHRTAGWTCPAARPRPPTGSAPGRRRCRRAAGRERLWLLHWLPAPLTLSLQELVLAKHLKQWCHSQLNKKVVISEHQGPPSPGGAGRGRRARWTAARG